MVYMYTIIFTLGLTFFFIGLFFKKFGKRELEDFSNQKLELTKKQVIFLRLGIVSQDYLC